MDNMKTIDGIDLSPILKPGASFQDIPTYIDCGGLYSVHMTWRPTLMSDPLGMNTRSADNGIQYVTCPDYQRGHVWSPAKQREYVEFCLRGGKSSRLLYWNCTSPSWLHSPMELVDGLQRLTAVDRFMNNRLKAFGLYYKQFKGQPCQLRQGYFIMAVNTLKSRTQVLQWYLELNAGGVVHTKSELDRVRKLLDGELEGNHETA